MRLSILAFAAGVLLLQWQAALPVMAVLGGLGGAALCGLFLSARRVHWASRGMSLLGATRLRLGGVGGAAAFGRSAFHRMRVARS